MEKVIAPKVPQNRKFGYQMVQVQARAEPASLHHKPNTLLFKGLFIDSFSCSLFYTLYHPEKYRRGIKGRGRSRSTDTRCVKIYFRS